MNENLEYKPIWNKNYFFFYKKTFDLSLFYEKLCNFYNNVELNNVIYYAHVYDKKSGLYYHPFPISGFKIKKLDINSSFLSLFSDKDITFATDMENNEFNNNFNCMYKYNIIYIYHSILKTLEGYNIPNAMLHDKRRENGLFFIFITKNCINTTDFDIFIDYFKL